MQAAGRPALKALSVIGGPPYGRVGFPEPYGLTSAAGTIKYSAGPACGRGLRLPGRAAGVPGIPCMLGLCDRPPGPAAGLGVKGS